MEGRVRNLTDFGAFIEIVPGKDGLCHISELSDEYVRSVGDVCKVGDIMQVKVIAVDDRSEDATLEILNNFAQRDTRLKVVHIAELPQGWLGKPHALEMAYRESQGEWLVFTDADVQFAPDLLRRALALMEQERSDHLTLLAGLDLRGFWEPTAVGYLGVCFALGVRPWRVSNPKSRVYMGVGAFQMIRRSTYEAIGTHRGLAMEVLDDMKLGKLVKLNGFRSGVAPSSSASASRESTQFASSVELTSRGT